MSIDNLTPEQLREVQERTRAIMKQWAEQGKVLEGGFMAMLAVVNPPIKPENVDDMKMAYMSGAQHLWASIFASLDPDKDPTPGDERRMMMIHKELESWEARIKFRAA